MDAHVNTENIEQILQGVTIPARPGLLAEVDKELAADDPDLRKVARAIERDVAISAAVLKTLNSPLFALRSKIAGIPQAVTLLGIRNTRSIVSGLMLRNAMGNKLQNLERFWDSAEKVASVSAYICSQLPRAPRDEAYTLGLFRDCGIPLLMQRFPEYRETLKMAAEQDRVLTEFEQLRHGTSHTSVGSIMARSWGLPESVCQAILHHHRPGIVGNDAGKENPTKTLVAVNFLAEHVIETSLQMRPDPQWETHGGAVLDYLALSDDEYYRIEDHAIEAFG